MVLRDKNMEGRQTFCLISSGGNLEGLYNSVRNPRPYLRYLSEMPIDLSDWRAWINGVADH